MIKNTLYMTENTFWSVYRNSWKIITNGLENIILGQLKIGEM